MVIFDVIASDPLHGERGNLVSAGSLRLSRGAGAPLAMTQMK
jgi:hypothetical protein